MNIKIVISALFINAIIPGICLNSQEIRKINGIVTSFTNIPLNKVKIDALKSGEVVHSDSAGCFSIDCKGNDVLRFSAAGFRERQIKIRKESLYRVDLLYNDNVRNFNEAVSHDHITEDVLKNAILKQESGNIRDFSKYKSIYELISSEIYSVKVVGNMIMNRKVKSLDDTPEVLLVVDDKIVKDISYINPAYVKSIEFIEDVGATLYGSMGANGVIRIILK